MKNQNNRENAPATEIVETIESVQGVIEMLESFFAEATTEAARSMYANLLIEKHGKLESLQAEKTWSTYTTENLDGCIDAMAKAVLNDPRDLTLSRLYIAAIKVRMSR